MKQPFYIVPFPWWFFKKLKEVKNFNLVLVICLDNFTLITQKWSYLNCDVSLCGHVLTTLFTNGNYDFSTGGTKWKNVKWMSAL